jgi:hypothetical protein
VIKGDKKLVINAASAAQKSADWIMGVDATAADQDQPPAEEGTQTEANSAEQPAAEVVAVPTGPARQLDLF